MAEQRKTIDVWRQLRVEIEADRRVERLIAELEAERALADRLYEWLKEFYLAPGHPAHAAYRERRSEDG